MKIQCDSCGMAEAEVLCCADEAVLCVVCDEAVHAANKLSSKHQRVLLVNHPPPGRGDQSPPCDICQEKKGYIFCLEDRALLCRNCDLGTHNKNPYTSAHRRFLITGVQVALQSSSSNAAPSGLRNLQEIQEAEIVQVNKDMEMEMDLAAASSTDTITAEFSYLQQQRVTDGLMEQWPAVQNILDNNVFDYSYDFSDLRTF